MDVKDEQLLLRAVPANFDQLLDVLSYEQLFFLSLDNDHPRSAFKSAWALEHLLQRSPEPSVLERYSSHVYSAYLRSTNWSVLRSFSKLMLLLLSRCDWMVKNGTDQKVALLEKTFEVLDDSDCPVALRVNCWDLLYAMTSEFDWLSMELRLRIELALENRPTPALKSRGLRILERMKLK